MSTVKTKKKVTITQYSNGWYIKISEHGMGLGVAGMIREPYEATELVFNLDSEFKKWFIEFFELKIL